MRTMHQYGCVTDRLRPVIAALALIVALAFQAVPARADGGDDAASNRAPRAVVEIGGLTVVLVSSDDQLHVFVDRIEDNAPAVDAAITITRAGSRSPLALGKVADGLFVAPYKRGGAHQDSFTVAVAAAAGTGEAKATLVYEAPPAAPARGGGFGRLLAIALVSGLIGSAATVLAMRRRARRPGASVPLVGAA